jgi:hypothetical protein
MNEQARLIFGITWWVVLLIAIAYVSFKEFRRGQLIKMEELLQYLQGCDLKTFFKMAKQHQVLQEITVPSYKVERHVYLLSKKYLELASSEWLGRTLATLMKWYYVQGNNDTWVGKSNFHQVIRLNFEQLCNHCSLERIGEILDSMDRFSIAQDLFWAKLKELRARAESSSTLGAH